MPLSYRKAVLFSSTHIFAALFITFTCLMAGFVVCLMEHFIWIICFLHAGHVLLRL